MSKRLLSIGAVALALTCVEATSLRAQTIPPATRPAAASIESQPVFSAARQSSRASAATATSRPATPGGALSSLGVDLGRMFLALGIVLAIIGAIYWLFRRFYGGAVSSATTGAVKVLSRTPIAPRQQVMLLKVGRRVIVVGDSNGSLATLSQIDDADEVAQLLGQLQAEQMHRAASFGNVFRRNQNTFDDAEAPAATADDVEPRVTNEPDAAAEPAAPDDQLSQQRSEIAGLLEKVRSLRGQIGP